MTTEEFTNPEPPGHPVLTPREIGQRPGVATMNVPGWGITGRAPSCRLWGSNQEGHQGLRCINMPGVEVKRRGLGQQMGQRVSDLQGCYRAHVIQQTSLNIHPGRGADRPHQNRPRAITRPHPWRRFADTPQCPLIVYTDVNGLFCENSFLLPCMARTIPPHLRDLRRLPCRLAPSGSW